MKIAVVTGTSRGIGEAFAACLLDSGYLVFGGSRKEARLTHPNFIDIELDVRKEDSVNRFFDEVAKKSEVVDLFVNNAGVCDLSRASETINDDFLNNFTTNVFGSFLMLKNLEEFLIESETKIYNILSTAINEQNEGTLSYSVAENAKKSLSTIMKKEWAKYDLSITDLIVPPTNTSLWDEYENIDQDLLLSLESLKLFFSDLINMKSPVKISEIELTL